MSGQRRNGGCGFGGVFVLLVVLGVIVKFIWWILAALAAAAMIAFVFYVVQRADKRRTAELARKAAIAARADEQHSQILAGDDRGIYGEYLPHEDFSIRAPQLAEWPN
jgi:hypothetical protein